MPVMADINTIYLTDSGRGIKSHSMIGGGGGAG
jgi:hypothetical protein